MTGIRIEGDKWKGGIVREDPNRERERERAKEKARSLISEL